MVLRTGVIKRKAAAAAAAERTEHALQQKLYTPIIITVIIIINWDCRTLVTYKNHFSFYSIFFVTPENKQTLSICEKIFNKKCSINGLFSHVWNPNKLRDDTDEAQRRRKNKNNTNWVWTTVKCHRKNRSQYIAMKWKPVCHVYFYSKLRQKKSQKQKKEKNTRIHIINKISLELCSLHLQD